MEMVFSLWAINVHHHGVCSHKTRQVSEFTLKGKVVVMVVVVGRLRSPVRIQGQFIIRARVQQGKEGE